LWAGVLAKLATRHSASTNCFFNLTEKMVVTTKSAIQCPSKNCVFAYFASSPDPAGKLHNHFNNLKVRDAEHELFFQKPHCVFCGDVIVSKTRKGLWKSGMNRHWLLSHSADFTEVEERRGTQGIVHNCSSSLWRGVIVTRIIGDCRHVIAIGAR
jgi:hypothetical protein